MKKGDIFEFFCHEAGHEHYCLIDFDGAREEEIRTLLSNLYAVDESDIVIRHQPLCLAPRRSIQNLSDLYREWNLRQNQNEYEGLPASIYLKEIAPDEIYRLFLDKKNNEMQIVLKNGGNITISVDAEKTEKQLTMEG